MSTDNSITPRLIEYMSGALDSELPPNVLVKTKHHILDTLSAMISGSVMHPGLLGKQFILQQGGTPEAQIIGSPHLTSAINAALANGMMAHSDETDDSNGSAGLHPGCATVPAALAMAEREDASGTDLIRSVALGYDIGSRTVRSLGREAMRARNHLPYSIGGTMAATAAAGSLARLDMEQYRPLLSYGAQQASGIMTYQRDVEHVEKAFIFGGMPCRNGVTAAQMVQNGFSGVHDTFIGDGNFLIAYADKPNKDELISELGSRYEVMLTNIKKYCTGFPIQSQAEGLLILKEKYGLKPDDISKIVVRLSKRDAHTVNDREMPDINLQYIFAVALIDGGISFEAAHSFERMSDPQIMALRSKITLIGDEALSNVDPMSQSIVEVTRPDGSTVQEHVVSFKGKAENPLTTEEVVAKATDLIEPIFGKSQTQELIDAINNLETVGKVRELRPLLSTNT